MISSRKIALGHLIGAQLVDRFVLLAVESPLANLDRRRLRRNALMLRLYEVVEELKRRPGERWRLLLPLLRHPNPEVRLRVAEACIEFAPERCLPLLQAWSDGPGGYFAAEAGWAIEMAGLGPFRLDLMVKPVIERLKREDAAKAAARSKSRQRT
jgi:hypothetical protein